MKDRKNIYPPVIEDNPGRHPYRRQQQMAQTYGWDGKWKQTTTVPSHKNIREVLSLPDGRNIGYVQNISGKEPIRMYLFRDSAVLDSIAYTRNFEPGEITIVFYNECKVFSTPTGNYVKEMFNDTIFLITKENTLIPRWVVDAGKYKLEGGWTLPVTRPA